MDKAEVPFLSTTELSRLIEKKEVSAVEATEAYLERIDDVDFKFNAYLTVSRKKAFQAAQEADQAIAKGNYLGPMHGIPVGVKDQLWTKGIRTTGGARHMQDFVPDEDATVVANLKKAGAVILGKLNLSEFAIGFPQPFSMPRNPWNLDTYPGASSGGSAVATSAFLCSTSLGEDTGGSIRMPAAWCGVVGLKVTWGRVSRYGLMRGVWSLDSVGPISQTVEDAAITFGAIAGHDPKDSYTWDIPVPDYRKALHGDIKGLKVGLVTEAVNKSATQPEVRDAVNNAATVLGELGASVSETSIPLSSDQMIILLVGLFVEPASTHARWIRERLQDYGFGNRVGLLTGSIMPAQAYYKAQKLREMLARQVREALEKFDVLVMPTIGGPAVDIGGYDRLPIPDLYTPIFNLAHSTAITVPCGFTSSGLPIGLQIGGRPLAEETVLKVAHAYEQATPWHTKRPPNA